MLSNRMRNGPPGAPRRAERRFLRKVMFKMENCGHGAKLLQGWGRGALEGLTKSDNIARVERRKHPPTLVWQKKILPSGPTSPLVPPCVPDHRLHVSACGDDQLPPANLKLRWLQSDDNSPRENMSNPNQFFTKHQSTSRWAMQKHPRQHHEQFPATPLTYNSPHKTFPEQLALRSCGTPQKRTVWVTRSPGGR